jgi:hypothetical protein
MKLYISVVLLCLSFAVGQAQTLKEVREAYPKAATSKENAQAFAALMAKAPTTDLLLSAYKGASLMINAKYGGNRVALLREGKPLIENALQKHPDNAELHLIRLSVQVGLPKIVPYKNDIKADKAFLLTHYPEQSAPLKQYIAAFIAQSSAFTPEEKASVKP